MSSRDLELALKDPSNLSPSELDDVLEAQLSVFRSLHDSDQSKDQVTKNETTVSIRTKRKGLRNLKTRI